MTIHGDNITDMNTAAAQLRYDPRILRINNIVAGDLPQRGIAEGTRTGALIEQHFERQRPED